MTRTIILTLAAIAMVAGGIWIWPVVQVMTGGAQ